MSLIVSFNICVFLIEEIKIGNKKLIFSNYRLKYFK